MKESEQGKKCNEESNKRKTQVCCYRMPSVGQPYSYCFMSIQQRSCDVYSRPVAATSGCHLVTHVAVTWIGLLLHIRSSFVVFIRPSSKMPAEYLKVSAAV